MKISEVQKFEHEGKDVTFIRVIPDNLHETIKEILSCLADLSWLSKISSEPVKESFKLNANKTVKALENSFLNSEDESQAKRRAGEYIVSVLSKNAIQSVELHVDMPLMELIGRKVKGNSGFDFYTEKNNPICLLFCGEAKYENGKNAFPSSLSQIEDFIEQKKHVSDLHLLEHFADEKSLNNIVSDIYGISSAFSTTQTIASSVIIERIKENQNFKRLAILSQSIILVGVDL
ncbi:MAG: hypothetical protein PHX62_05315 [Bacilli bacterium]|nr:hypothetical protein [Bacilli bacterium]